MEIHGKKNGKKSQRIKTKKFTLYSIIFVCFVLIFSAYYYPNIRYTGIYALDVIRGKDPYIRVIDNPAWAEKLDLPGISNFHKVSDDLYRGAQPTQEGMKELKKLGIKTIVNLRFAHSDKDELKNIDLAYEQIEMSTAKPKISDITNFLKIVNDSNNTPVFVHCHYGADRTGTMCAMYRIIVQDWSKEEAIQEMTEGGFGFHSIWGNLPDFIRKCDIEEIKHKVELIEQNYTIAPVSAPN